jgi:hypothetical protein
MKTQFIVSEIHFHFKKIVKQLSLIGTLYLEVCTLFSKIMPNFCKHRAISVFKLKDSASGTFIFAIKLN